MDDNLILFLGRFHPLIVHLPIGILLLAGLMQLISFKSKSYSKALSPAISFSLFWGGLSSLAAISIGWLLSLQGEYDADTLFWHKWLGIFLTLFSFFAWILKTNTIKLQKSIFYIAFGIVILLVAITGHLGGSLTHGDTYLVHYAPHFIKKMIGAEINSENNLFKDIHPDSIAVYPYFIQPILDKKCTGCHNSTKLEGGLLLTSYKEIFEGGDNGTVINTKSPFKSELLNRVTLPKGHKKFMPPKGSLVTNGEIQIVEWWMRNGADSISKFIDSDGLDEKLLHTLLRDYELDYSPRPYYEKVKVDSLPRLTIAELTQNEFVVDDMGETNNTISITYQGNSIKKEQIEKLLLAKDQITWLNLSNCNLTDDLLSNIKKFKNLTRLNIHSNPITDQGIVYLQNLEHLNSINVYNTKISNTSLKKLLHLPALSKLYVWKTNITTEKIQEMSEKFSHIEIIANLN